MDVSQRRIPSRRGGRHVGRRARGAVRYNVRLHQAYRTTVTLRNDTRNALELTVRAGSPERWAVAPSTVFLEAGRTMRVDLRLKLAREIRPKKTAGAAVREGDDDGGGAARQRDIFHVKGEFFEQSFTPRSSWPPRKRSPPLNDANRTRAFTIDRPPRVRAAAAPVASTSSRDTTHRALVPLARVPPLSDEDRRGFRPRQGSIRRRLQGLGAGGSKHVSTRGTRAGFGPRRRGTEGTPRSGSQSRARAVHWEDETSKKVDAYRRRVDELEKLRAQSELATSDKDELIRALYARLELAKTAEDDARARETHAETLAEPAAKNPPPDLEPDLHAARVEQAELHGANAALRGRVQELDGECQAAREEIAGLRRRCRLLEQDIAPELSIWSTRRSSRSEPRLRAQSLKALRVLEAKDAVLLARERETAEARAAECGARSRRRSPRPGASWTRARLGSCPYWRNARVSARSLTRFDAQWTGTEKSLRVEVEKLGEELRIANERLDRTKEELTGGASRPRRNPRSPGRRLPRPPRRSRLPTRRLPSSEPRSEPRRRLEYPSARGSPRTSHPPGPTWRR